MSVVRDPTRSTNVDTLMPQAQDSTGPGTANGALLGYTSVLPSFADTPISPNPQTSRGKEIVAHLRGSAIAKTISNAVAAVPVVQNKKLLSATVQPEELPSGLTKDMDKLAAYCEDVQLAPVVLAGMHGGSTLDHVEQRSVGPVVMLDADFASTSATSHAATDSCASPTGHEDVVPVSALLTMHVAMATSASPTAVVEHLDVGATVMQTVNSVSAPCTQIKAGVCPALAVQT